LSDSEHLLGSTLSDFSGTGCRSEWHTFKELEGWKETSWIA